MKKASPSSVAHFSTLPASDARRNPSPNGEIHIWIMNGLGRAYFLPSLPLEAITNNFCVFISLDIVVRLRDTLNHFH